MLGKVIKHELRAAGRELLPFFGLALVASSVVRLLFWLAPMMWAPAAAFITSIGAMFGVLLVVAVMLVGLAIPVIRFYKSMVSDEGYLSHTLPVKTGTHITARVITGSLFFILGSLVAVACATILIPGFWPAVLNSPVFSSGAGGVSLNYALVDLPAGLVLSLVGLILVFLVVAAVSNLVKIYTSIAIGQKLTRNKVVGSVLGYLLVNTVQGFATLFLMLLPAFAIIGGDADALNRYIFSMMAADPIANLGSMLGFLWGFVGIVSAVTLVFTVIQWWLTWFFLDKKLNLE